MSLMLYATAELLVIIISAGIACNVSVFLCVNKPLLSDSAWTSCSVDHHGCEYFGRDCLFH